MTIGHLLESELSKAKCFLGGQVDATAFEGHDREKEAEEVLHAHGFQRYGKERLYNGKTGRMMDCMIYMGTVYYQRLKHLVADKIHCLTPDHEVLTGSGWKGIQEVTLNDKVATLQDGELKYENPLQLYQYDYNGKMYHIESQQVDLKVTPNHQMWVAKPYGRKREYTYGFHKAEDIAGKMVRYQKDAEWNVPKYQFTLSEFKAQPDKKVDMDPWLTFFGIWIAEGWAIKRPRDANYFDYRVIIAANKQRVKDALRDALPKLGFHFREDKSQKFYISDHQLCNYLQPLSVGATNKRLPDWVWKLNQQQCQTLIEGLLLGDGHSKWSDSVVYSTHSTGLADDVQKLCLHAGWSANKRLHTPATYTIGNDSGFTTCDGWSMSIVKTKNKPTMNHGHAKTQSGQLEEWVDYSGKVYCLEVPGHVFYVRRNGLPVWTGNSRSRGANNMMTRQPVEGRVRDGGLRFGEMERVCLFVDVG